MQGTTVKATGFWVVAGDYLMNDAINFLVFNFLFIWELSWYFAIWVSILLNYMQHPFVTGEVMQSPIADHSLVKVSQAV